MNSKYIYTSYIKKLAPVDDFDTEKFILEIQKHECIWNVNSKSYNLKCVKNRETKKRAWEEITRIFHPNFDNLSLEERQKKVEILSKKWANIRKYYTDEVRKPANSPPKKRQRRYHHLLTFLDDSVTKRRVPRIREFKNIGNEKINVESSSDSESGELYIVEDADELNRMSTQSGNPPVAPALLDNKTNNPDPYPDEKQDVNKTINLWDNPVTYANIKNAPAKPPNVISEMMGKNPEIIKLLNEPPGPPSDIDHILNVPLAKPLDFSVLSKPLTLDQTTEASKRFLLSLLPEIMSLNVKQNLQFRLGIMDLLNDIKFKVNPNLDNKVFPNINFN